mmetsp:Transcript_41622/g.47933  ORF Transcript_41622/g.47933 Transcript_41622/m.47933 type:complete len:483 (+) Transcript_41622:135-1583(+)
MELLREESDLYSPNLPRKRMTSILLLNAFMVTGDIGVYGALMSQFQIELGIDKLQTSILFSAFMATNILVMPLTTKLANRGVDVFKMLTVSNVITVLGYALLSSVYKSYYLHLACRIFLGAAAAPSYALLLPMVKQIALEKDRTVNTAFLSTSYSMGQITFTWLAGPLYAYYKTASVVFELQSLLMAGMVILRFLLQVQPISYYTIGTPTLSQSLTMSTSAVDTERSLTSNNYPINDGTINTTTSQRRGVLSNPYVMIVLLLSSLRDILSGNFSLWGTSYALGRWDITVSQAGILVTFVGIFGLIFGNAIVSCGVDKWMKRNCHSKRDKGIAFGVVLVIFWGLGSLCAMISVYLQGMEIVTTLFCFHLTFYQTTAAPIWRLLFLVHPFNQDKLVACLDRLLALTIGFIISPILAGAIEDIYGVVVGYNLLLLIYPINLVISAVLVFMLKYPDRWDYYLRKLNLSFPQSPLEIGSCSKSKAGI